MAGWLITSLINNKFLFAKNIRRYKKFILASLILASVNIFFAVNRPAAIYSWTKIGELLALVWLVKENKSFIYRHLGWWLLIWFSIESFLVIGQALKQASLGGVFWWLGERSFSLSTPGIAKASFGGQLFLRPYGSFSHPNSLAGFVLALAFFALTYSGFQRWRRYYLALSVVILLLTFSRASLFVGLVLLVLWLRRIGKISHFLFKLFMLGLFLFLMAVVFKLRFSPAVFYRFLLTIGAVKMIFFQPFLGVGMRNFIVRLADFWPSGQINNLFFQPVHNIYLLWLAETGALGVLWMLWVYRQFFSKKIFFGKVSFAFLAILLTGLFDHYWLTLQQNFLLMGLVIGLL